MKSYSKFFGMAVVAVSLFALGCGGAGRGNQNTDRTPVLTALTPNNVAVGAPGFTLQVDGGEFLAGAKVLWNGVERPTTEVSPSRLTAEIPAGDLQQQTTANVTVRNTNGRVSNALPFFVGNPNPAPTITSLTPNSANAGGAAFPLTINGTNFVNGAQARWDGQVRNTLFVSPTQLQITVSQADIAQAGQHQITVVNPAPGGGVSNAVTFTVQ